MVEINVGFAGSSVFRM
jgi:hypothetical protein